MALASELYTIESTLTLAGSAGMVTLAGNFLHYYFGFNPKYTSIITSYLLAVGGLIYYGEYSFNAIIVFFFNGMLICSAAVGIAQVSGHKSITPSQPTFRASMKGEGNRKYFFFKWY